ncbi:FUCOSYLTRANSFERASE 2-RELATED [Salix koriyanagi]|uniref:Fucosyltransferase n=1 Tax=Salix koriyanagi TaxID=2511006 RepID=A0A9Q0SZ64_9ROSI|nr:FUCOSYLTRANSFERASE 2-RELATED [Salix koriyanagi]
MVSDEFSGMISTIRDQTSWNKTGFQFKMQRNGYCSKIPYAFLIVFSVLLMFLIVQQRSKTFEVNGGDATINVLAGGGAAQTETPEVADSGNVSSQQVLDELFAPGHDKGSCLSRYEFVVYRKPSSHKPSPYLLSKLRKYESLHKLCGPFTESYNKTLEQLKSGRNVSTTDCNYVVYTPLSGLGNRMLTIASAFLYALLTNRVLLVEFGSEIAGLFCEPFQQTTLLLPMDFPLRSQFDNFSQVYPRTYGNMLKSGIINTSMMSPPPPFLYIYLAYDIDRYDGLFYCDQNQDQLRKVPWFYRAYLSKADERIGIQVRVFDTKVTPFQTVVDQILSCTIKEKLLPDVLEKRSSAASLSKNQSLKAVLVTSLYSEYYEHIKGVYWTKPTVSGEVIGVYQPSHEEHELYGNNMHSMKAWTEIYLLSMSNALITSSWSTFGYVAQSLGGLKPWILYSPLNGTAPDPPCVRAMSMEPCFHFPPSHGCKAEVNVGHVKHCEDVEWGLKLVKDH